MLLSGTITDLSGQESYSGYGGSIAAVADVLGDWREEIVTSVDGELRVYTTTIEAADRRVWLMEDVLYSHDVAHAAMGYFQVPLPSYDLSSTP